MDSKHPIIPADLYLLNLVGDPEISPDGTRIAWVQTEIDGENNHYNSAIWMSSKKHDGEFGPPVRVTYGSQNVKGGVKEGSPRFSPDSTCLAFTSNRSGRNNIWLINIERGGEARLITESNNGISSITWAPDGKHLAFVSREPKTEPCNEAEARQSKDVTVVTRLRYKANGVPYVTDPRALQLFMINIDTGEVKQLTFGEYDCFSPAFSPDGKSLAFVSCREANCETHMIPDLWVLALENGKLTRLTHGQGSVAAPSYSPDGRFIAYIGSLRKDVAAAKSEILVVPASGGHIEVLTSEFDRSIGCSVSTDTRADPGRVGPWWSKDGTFIYFVATDRGYSKIFRVSFGSFKVEEVGVAQSVCSIQNSASFHYPPVISSLAFRTVGQEEIFAFVGSSELNPCDVYAATGLAIEETAIEPSRSKVKHWQYDIVSVKRLFAQCARLTSINQKLLDSRVLVQPEPFMFHGSDGVELEGWYMKPLGSEGQKFPSIVEIHGGPAVTYGLAYFHEFQLFASNGYGVFYCNPRGSLGYGEWFAQQVIGDQGGMDYRDIMALREHAETLDWVDPLRIGVTGGSYGGFMTNWIVGHTGKFKAAVTQRSISNWYTKYGTSDIGFYGNKKGMGMRDLWDNEDWLMERSPIRYAPNVNTPVLILHSEQDYRCPMEQAEQWYIALKRLGKTVEFVRFAGENHELSRSGKPWNRRLRLVHMLNWFAKYLG